MDSEWAPYEVKIRRSRVPEDAFETNNPARCRQKPSEAVFDSSDQAFSGLLGTNFRGFLNPKWFPERKALPSTFYDSNTWKN